MRKKLILIMAFSFLNGLVLAQGTTTENVTKNYSNTIKLSLVHFSIRQTYGQKNILRQIGGYYERNLNKNWYLCAGYSQWESLIKDNFSKLVFEPSDTTIGSLGGRGKYKMIDAYIFYRHPLKFNNHFLNVGVGASYTWGLNSYLQYFQQNVWAYPPDAQYIYQEERKHYWGIIPQVSYDFLCLKNRVCLGVDLKGRYYFSLVKAQYDYGIHLGVNF